MMPRPGTILLSVLCGLACLGPCTQRAATSRLPIELHTSAGLIRVTPRYCGELVKVWGTVSPSCDVVVKLASPREPALFSRKGKVGPFWLSVDRVRFENVPWMYKVKSSAPIDEILSPEEQIRYQLGVRGLKASIGVQKGVDRDLYLNELIMTRKADRLFSFGHTGVRRKGRSFATSFFWPSDGPPGRYLIEAFAVTGERIAGYRTRVLEVKKVGLEAWVSRLAQGHGIFYGAFAVSLAIAAGLIASLVFKRPQGHIAKS